MRKKTAREPRESALASGWTVEAEPAPEAGSATPEAGPAPTRSGEGSAALAAAHDAESGDDGASPQLSNAALVLLGVFGGLYLLYAWIWLSWAQAYSEMNAAAASGSGALGAALQQLVFWVAPLAPVLWFLTALLMNREAGLRRLAIWILIGAIVLVPLPVLGGAGA